MKKKPDKKVTPINAWAAFGNDGIMDIGGALAIYPTKKDGMKYWAGVRRVIILIDE